MPPALTSNVGSRLDVPSLHALLRLAVEGAPPASAVEWSALLALAERERVLALIWKRSADIIHRDAPAPVAAGWKRRAVASGLHSVRQLELLTTTVNALAVCGIDAIVLKGAPLAQCLYGDFTVRPSIDLDLYVPLQQREAAGKAFVDLGWRLTTGAAPEEEGFERSLAGSTFRLEVHSSPLDDPLLDHLSFPLESMDVELGDHVLRAHSGRFQPAYLAAHLAKHHEKPLLWAIDFQALWSLLDGEAREAALRAAKEAGLARHLRWAIEIASLVESGGEELRAATPKLRRLARALTPRSDAGRLLRLVMLSSSAAEAWRVFTGRVWPAAWRRGWRRAPAYFARRAIRWTYRHAVFERPAPMLEAATPRVVGLSADASDESLIEALRSAPVWVVPPDGSMEPAIPRFGAIRVMPLDRIQVRAGDIVVTREARGRCRLRRVLSLAGETLRCTSDAQFDASELIPQGALLGVCDLVDVGGQHVPVSSRPYGSIGLLRAIMRSRFTASLRTRSI